MPSIAQHTHCVDFFIDSPSCGLAAKFRSGLERQIYRLALYRGSVARRGSLRGAQKSFRRYFFGCADGERLPRVERAVRA